MEVTVYTKPNCYECRGTIRQLTNAGIPFTTAPLDDNIREAALQQNILSAPVVAVGDKLLWGGFRPDRIAALKVAA